MPDVDNTVLDEWTLVHFGIGVLWGYWGRALWLLILLAVIWELIENGRRPERVIPFFAAECQENAVVDIAMTIGGWYAGQYGR